MPVRPAAPLAFGLALAAAAPALPQGAAPAPGWAVEAAAVPLRAPGASAASNVVVAGTGPMASLRVARAVAPRLSLSASVAYGEVRGARRDVYERPSGPTRTDTYDYRALPVMAGLDYAWPMRRVEGVAGLEGGWVKAGWRVAAHEDPAGLGAPSSSFGGGAAAALRLGVRAPLAGRAALAAGVRAFAGPGTLEGNGAWVLPEVGLRWRF